MDWSKRVEEVMHGDYSPLACSEDATDADYIHEGIRKIQDLIAAGVGDICEAIREEGRRDLSHEHDEACAEVGQLKRDLQDSVTQLEITTHDYDDSMTEVRRLQGQVESLTKCQTPHFKARKKAGPKPVGAGGWGCDD